jgi:outer membrane protein TolC
MRAALLMLLSQAATARPLTVEDALAEVLRTHPQLVAARARLEFGKESARSILARVLPSIHLSEEYQHWDSQFRVSFQIPLAPMPASFLAREQDTNSFTAAVDQPLLGLGKITEEYLAHSQDREVARHGLRTVEEELSAALRVSFLRHFQARAARDVALASAGQLDEQVTVTEAKVKAGVLTTADLLRVGVAAANARQQALVAGARAEVARAQILAAVGLSPDAPVELVEPPLPSLPPAASFEDAVRARPEVAAARAAASSADHRRRASLWAMAPDLDAEGAYLRIDGQVFAPHDSAFVGIRASWAIWEWGASFFVMRAAAAAAQAAHADLESRKRQVEVEVASRRAELGAAASAVQLADTTIASAEEAYRVMAAQVRAGAATTTDLLDAQAALTQARLNRSGARYEEAIARVNLEHAQGTDHKDAK